MPNVSIQTSNPVACVGRQTTLTAMGATNYTWQPGNILTQAWSISPLSATVYTVTGNTLGCTNTAVITMPVANVPTVSIAGSSVICLGKTALLLASGAVNYTWLPGNVPSQILNISPVATTSYIVSGEAAGCTSTAAITMSVVNPPTITVAASATSICMGSQVHFIASGANIYNWSNGNTNPAMFVYPATTTNYTVTGTDVNNCSGSTVISVFVHTVSPIAIAGSSSTICAGEPVSLSASGATSYTWNNGSQANPVTVFPAISTIYTVTGNDPLNGCTTSGTYVQQVNDCTGLSSPGIADAPFQLYPNPTSGQFKISTEEECEMIICNSLGEVVYKNMHNGTSEINLENLVKGIYHVIIQQDKQAVNYKLIKQ